MVTMEKYGGDTGKGVDGQWWVYPGLDRLTMNHLLQYLMSEDNLIIDPVVFDQSQDMGKPLNHYFINSSHNTYLNGEWIISIYVKSCDRHVIRSPGTIGVSA